VGKDFTGQADFTGQGKLKTHRRAGRGRSPAGGQKKVDGAKLKVEMWKEGMNQGRLSGEFRDRTKQFAAATIRLFVKLPKGREEVRILGKQLLRSGTSVAAHVREASRSRSGEEFVSKLGGALQETDESQMWLELLRADCGIAPADTLPMEKEADELMAIMTTMIKRTKEKN
jgi:four helix bundle protein